MGRAMKIITLVAATALLATPALAADAIVYNEPAPVVTDTFSWTGGYVGVSAGYAWGKSPFRNRSDDGEGGEYVEGTNYDPDGFLGGLYAGYNKQLNNNVVLGVDADLNIANIKGEGSDYFDYTHGDIYGAYPSSKMKWNGAVRARLGYAYDRIMPYIAGGVSFGEYKFDLQDTFDGFMLFSEKSTKTGWNIGAGVDYAVTDNIILRAEYRYTDFGSKTFHGLWYEDTGKIKLSTHDVRVGVAYKF